MNTNPLTAIRKHFSAGFVLTLAFVGLLLLVGCAQDDDVDNTVIAQRYVENLGEGNLDDAAELVCEERADTIATAMVTEENQENFSFENLSCSQRGDGVACSFTVRQNPPAEDAAGTTVRESYNRSVIFSFQNGLICGFEEEVAE